jgi:DNA-binding CsgD family transcriptional regulator
MGLPANGRPTRGCGRSIVESVQDVAVGSRHLVGREEELASLGALLDSPDELPAVAVVVGEAGIGKTSLWLAAGEEARARGFRVLSCRPSETEAQFSFSGLADLVGGLVPDVLSELPGPQRRALEAALALSERDRRAEEGVVAFAFLSVVRKLAEVSRIVLAVDDIQWLDMPSLILLRYALPRFESEPIATLLTARGEVPSWLRRDEQLLELELRPLSVGAVRELLRTHLDVSFPRPALLRIWEASAGNPFFALELARALERRGGRIEPGEELPIPPALNELLRERLDGLSASALGVTQTVAAIAKPSRAFVVTAAGRGAERGLAETIEAEVLELDGDRLRFTHPLLRSAVSSRLTPQERTSLHRRLARLVTGVEEQARHLALAAQGPSRMAASALDEAAEAAHNRGASTAAAELAEQALQLTPASDAEDVLRRTLLAAERLGQAGDERRAIVVLEQAHEATPPGAERAAVLLRLSQATHRVHGAGEAARLSRSALVEAGGDAALEAAVHLWLADLTRFVEGPSVERGLEHAELALAAAARAGDPLLRCRALANFGLMRFVAGRGVPDAEMEEALALERSLGGWPLTDATWTVGHQLGWSGEDLERAREHLHAYRDAMRARDSIEEGHSLHWLSLLEWRAGNWELAARYAGDLLALIAQTGAEGETPVIEEDAVRVMAYRGQIEDARARAEHALARAQELGIRVAEAAHLWALGFIELSAGDAAAALGPLRRSWRIFDELGYLEPGHRLELGDTLEALIAVGELDEAERRLAPWEERARALDRAWAIAILARCRALLRAARVDLEGAFAAFDEALAEHARSVYPFEYSRTLLALGMVQRRAKRRAAARATLEQAVGIFEELGAPLWTEKARAELARIGGRTPSRGDLTEAERRIAALVAEGRTNREVAAALFLTEHSVETALTRVYRKLGVRSRAELARYFAAKS